MFHSKNKFDEKLNMNGDKKKVMSQTFFIKKKFKLFALDMFHDKALML